MPLRVNPIILLGLIIAFILTVAVFASAMGGSPGDAVGAAMGQIGKPYVFGTDGPGTFSCAGLMRYALRAAGVDTNAPWSHEGYLSAYPNDATPQYGDIVVYDSGVAMYIGNDTVVMANAADGVVGTYPLNSIGTILGYANPYGGGAAPAADPAATGSTLPADTTGGLGNALGDTTGGLVNGLGDATGGLATGLGDATGMGTTPTDTTGGMGTYTDPNAMGLGTYTDPNAIGLGTYTDPNATGLVNYTDPNAPVTYDPNAPVTYDPNAPVTY